MEIIRASNKTTEAINIHPGGKKAKMPNETFSIAIIYLYVIVDSI
jgi:hypothetical protein